MNRAEHDRDLGLPEGSWHKRIAPEDAEPRPSASPAERAKWRVYACQNLSGVIDYFRRLPEEEKQPEMIAGLTRAGHLIAWQCPGPALEVIDVARRWFGDPVPEDLREPLALLENAAGYARRLLP